MAIFRSAKVLFSTSGTPEHILNNAGRPSPAPPPPAGKFVLQQQPTIWPCHSKTHAPRSEHTKRSERERGRNARGSGGNWRINLLLTSITGSITRKHDYFTAEWKSNPPEPAGKRAKYSCIYFDGFCCSLRTSKHQTAELPSVFS